MSSSRERDLEAIRLCDEIAREHELHEEDSEALGSVAIHMVLDLYPDVRSLIRPQHIREGRNEGENDG